jgi:hypothetical protein
MIYLLKTDDANLFKVKKYRYQMLPNLLINRGSKGHRFTFFRRDAGNAELGCQTNIFLYVLSATLREIYF